MRPSVAVRRARRSILPALFVACMTGCGGADEAPTHDEGNLFGKPAAPLGPEPSGEPTRFPIVLAHGFDASPSNRWGWFGVAEALERDGHVVHVATVPPCDSPEVRAEFLREFVDAALADGAGKVNLLAHSMGGLDCRHLVSVLGYGDRVASLTTISTPHGGTAVADTALAFLDGTHASEKIVDALASAWGLSFSDVAGDSHVRAALEAISEANAASFAETHPDDPGVFYQSWAGVSSIAGIRNPKDRGACAPALLGDGGKADKMDATLVPMAAITAHGTKLLPNDGMATVASARHGEFRGCIPADHLDEVGQVRDQGADPRTGFDHVRFYRNVAYELAAGGF